MCGICGYCGKNSLRDKGLIEEMTNTLVHRGPDEKGIYVDKEIALGARRLSIIDITKGSQPVSNEDKTIWVAFNGEIYNFQEIREELKTKGHSFVSGSDTEVIVHSYEEWGLEFVNHFRGMFAFALWDDKEKQLVLARDRIGIKPLYYTLLPDGTIIFASEIKAILKYPAVKKEIELKALDCFLSLEYIISPLSIFKNIYKLQQGHLLIYHDGKIKIKDYWNLIEKVKSAEVKKLELEVYKEKLISLIRESVKYRLISDVPLGAFLSGGIDSSTIVAMMNMEGIRPIRTFSIGFADKSYNELKYARIVSSLFSTLHYEQVIEPNAIELVNSLIYYLDEPLGDYSIFPTYLVSKLARTEVKVVLSGDGGDELFGGYEYYIAQKLSHLYDKFPCFIKKNIIQSIFDKIPPSSKKKGFINICKRFIEGNKKLPIYRHYRWCIFLSEVEKNILYTDDFKKSLDNFSFFELIEPYQKEGEKFDEINIELFLDLKTYLVDDILVKVDRMSMATSLEARVPFLDHKLVEWVMSLNGNLKLKGLTSKWLLNKAMEKYLPKNILYRKKEGFSIPIKNWLKNELKDLMESILNKDTITSDNLFNYEYIEQLKKEHLSGVYDHSHRLWALIIFHLWKRQFLNC